MKNKQLYRVSASFSLLLLSSLASAAGSSNTMLNVIASVPSSCQISTHSVMFGNYDPASSSATTATGNVTLTCVKGSLPTVTMDWGQNASGNFRAMKGGNSEVLQYQLYQPSSNTPGIACTYNESVVWGNTAGEKFVATVSPSIVPRTYNICGVIPAGQDVSTDFYQDKVIAQVDF